MKKKPIIKSKKFVVYIYQGTQGGGSICPTNSKGKMLDQAAPFETKEEAMSAFGAILDAHLKCK